MLINFENAKALYVAPHSRTVSIDAETSLLTGSPTYGESGRAGQNIIIIGGSGEDEY